MCDYSIVAVRTRCVQHLKSIHGWNEEEDRFEDSTEEVQSERLNYSIDSTDTSTLYNEESSSEDEPQNEKEETSEFSSQFWLNVILPGIFGSRDEDWEAELSRLESYLFTDNDPTFDDEQSDFFLN